MKTLLKIIKALCVIVGVAAQSASGVLFCSSLNGPYCDALDAGFVEAPPHARQNLDVDAEKLKPVRLSKTEKYLEQYELQSAGSDDASSENDDRFLLEFNDLLEKSFALLDEVEVVGSKNSKTSAYNLGLTGEFKRVERMDGDELKEFFEMALNKLLLSSDATLQELSLTVEGIHATLDQLKALKDYSTYQFQYLDEFDLLKIGYKFAKSRIPEIQRTFDQLVTAESAQNREQAFETAVRLFQIAEDFSIAENEASIINDDTTSDDIIATD
ncbi:hypothetical protein CCR75_007423 [Bremia lactucae]|uniref:Secreted protein n=1 Tax=Bremia lactucae TaxID=4779 RepID=A0A976NZR1_BRELC|nr:hypothetical protein CCR75_007423 [Bremia lactucae]